MTSCNKHPLSSRCSSRQSTSKCDARSQSSSSRRTTRQSHLLSWYIPRNVNGGEPLSDHSAEMEDVKISTRESNDRTKEIPSPLHDNSKQLWDLKYSDDKVRSLPFPAPHRPKLYEHDVPHANNLTHLFKTTNYPASVLYSRYGIPLFPSPYQVDKFNYQLWSNNPLQSMFAHVGGVQRRHFTVAPDWRHLTNNM